jgi:hypothetical protein
VKPLVFVSHTHEDDRLATALKDSISELLLDGVEFFVSSDRMSIIGGDRWLEKIESGLLRSSIVVVLCTPESVKRPWVNFEAGGAWSTKKRVIPLCCREMTPAQLPAPLSSLQAYTVARAEDIHDLVTLIAQEAGLKPPDFDVGQLVRLLGETAVSISEDVTPSEPEISPAVEPILPASIGLQLKVHDEDFYDDVYEHDARDGARNLVDKGIETTLAKLRAFLGARFGPSQVALQYKTVKFPGGSIDARKDEEIKGMGRESSVWSEFRVRTEGPDLSLIRDIRSKLGGALQNARFEFVGAVSIESLAQELYAREVPVVEWGSDYLTVDKTPAFDQQIIIRSKKDTTIIDLPKCAIEKAELAAILNPVFSFLGLGKHFGKASVGR